MIITFVPKKAICHLVQQCNTGKINRSDCNQRPFSGRRTCHLARTDGSTGASGLAELSGSLLLAANNFYRTFTDGPAATTAAKALPEMRGSGRTRRGKSYESWTCNLSSRRRRTRSDSLWRQ